MNSVVRKKKITLATIKSFIRKNRERLFIKVGSRFDGMTDCVQDCEGDWNPIEDERKTERSELRLNFDNTQGIRYAWFVGSSRDYFKDYKEGNYVGYEIYNCCGNFILAIEV